MPYLVQRMSSCGTYTTRVLNKGLPRTSLRELHMMHRVLPQQHVKQRQSAEGVNCVNHEGPRTAVTVFTVHGASSTPWQIFHTNLQTKKLQKKDEKINYQRKPRDPCCRDHYCYYYL